MYFDIKRNIKKSLSNSPVGSFVALGASFAMAGTYILVVYLALCLGIPLIIIGVILLGTTLCILYYVKEWFLDDVE